ncbi:uncharacterized protein LOC128988797 isoform X1 [Macrosteles quadrilineatus]|uniref:uncharacterized protein LOC128988797 isoform X1 n=1 Tax=Macrosteles quadrilineatus TaxID=74068 RepID=UPI0023E0D538|nr:uncharacterized protein LOC128988797 isoform X1 [Macrosteles quadrilineatus]
MDPVGSWSAYAASYNRLTGSASNGDYPHHLAATNPGPSPSTTSPLLLQAAHPTSSPAFTPSSFLSPPPVGYDPVFSPFLHANQKAHYPQALTVAQHRQVIASTKQVSADNDSLRESYTPVHPQPLPPPNPAFFEQASGSVQPTTIAWSHQSNSHSQLPSPFGVLPHESVVGSSTGSNFNPAHFAAAQTLNHINSQLAAVSYSDTSKRLTTRPMQSPPSKPITPNVTSSGYYQQASPISGNQYIASKTQVPNVMVPSANMSKDYNASLSHIHASVAAFPPRISENQSSEFQSPTTKSNSSVPNKITERRDSGHESTQSSPISFAVMDSNQNRSSSKIPPARSGIPQQSQLQQQLLNHQKTGAYRGSTPESEYTQVSAGRNTASTDAGYSSGSSVGHGGVDASLQRSPLDSHVTSPTGYPAYHSPMTSMSSPSPVQQHVDQNVSYRQNPSPQFNPTSPLDASLSRHPSVITRGDPKYANDTFPPKQCWDGTEQLRSQNYSNYSSDVSPNPSNISIQHQRTSHMVTDRHQEYLASGNQSIKGDPMTIVKNLQNLQQHCQPPPVTTDIKVEFENPNPAIKNCGSPSKRKKSIDSKILVAQPDPSNRVPPPAHLNQPQQNSGGVEHNSQKPEISTFTPQNTPHPDSKPTNVPFHPHDVSHSGGQISYLTSHKMPKSQDQKNINPNLQSKSSATNPNQYNINDRLPKVDVEDTPIAKVIVPDVEEELGFLAETPNPNPKPNSAIMNIPPVKLYTNPKSSFMESYLKFIQGEKESSPPPRQKPARLRYVPMSRKPQQEKQQLKKARKKSKTPPPLQSDVEEDVDDPRYFPLPKDPSSRKLNSSDSEETDYDNLIPAVAHKTSSNNASREATDNEEQKKSSKRVPKVKRKSHLTRKRKRSSSEESQEPLPVPTRRSARRKAKETPSLDEKLDELFSGNSDSDQAWSPDEDSDDEDEYGKAFGSGRRRKSKALSGSRFLESSDEEKKSKPKAEVVDVSGICPVCNSNFADDPTDAVKCSSCKNQFHCSCLSLQTMQRVLKMGSKRGTWRCDSCKSAPARGGSKGSQKIRKRETRRAVKAFKATKEKEEIDATLGTEDYFPFKSGEFIVVKEELTEKYPALWRVDGKTLLQKYESFDQNGEKLYRNISTYSGWTPQNRGIYQKVPVQFIVQSRSETIVRFLRSEMVDPAVEQAYLEHSLLQTAKYQDNFEVYIQTLISQALDANFLAEIFAEKDEYFLQNVEVIDRLTEERRVRLVAAVGWPVESALQRSVTTWPCYNVLADLKAGPVPVCDACERNMVHARIILYGQPYNPNTLDGCEVENNRNEKDFMICLECIKFVQLYNKLVHQKYIMYIDCVKRVQEKRKTDSGKDTTVILNELLADEEWLSKLFRQVRTVWADVEKAEREKKKKLGLPVEPPGGVPNEEQGKDVEAAEQGDNEDDVVIEKALVTEIKVEKDSDAEEGETFGKEDDVNDVTVSIVQEGSSVSIMQEGSSVSIVQEGSSQATEQVAEVETPVEDVSIERVQCES